MLVDELSLSTMYLSYLTMPFDCSNVQSILQHICWCRRHYPKNIPIVFARLSSLNEIIAVPVNEAPQHKGVMIKSVRRAIHAFYDSSSTIMSWCSPIFMTVPWALGMMSKGALSSAQGPSLHFPKQYLQWASVANKFIHASKETGRFWCARSKLVMCAGISSPLQIFATSMTMMSETMAER